ncbi:hypothetical protein MUP77_05930 [Candidatus Bathyarchaeota archaeon]|nr:hypothetical protein [Candidatus Bathyarchaeota archaeon]
MGHNKKHTAYDVWENLADIYAEEVDTKPNNAHLEKSSTLSLLPSVKDKYV